MKTWSADIRQFHGYYLPNFCWPPVLDIFALSPKVVVIPGSVNPVVVPGAIRYRMESIAPVGRVTVVVILMTHALPEAPSVDWVPQ